MRTATERGKGREYQCIWVTDLLQLAFLPHGYIKLNIDYGIYTVYTALLRLGGAAVARVYLKSGNELSKC